MPTDQPIADPLSGDLDEESEARDARLGFVPEMVKRVAVAGLGAIFMTEEGIRSLAGQLKLPKEVLTFVLSQAEKTKDELARIVSDELRRFLQSDKLREEFLKLLGGMSVEINAQVRLVPSERKPGEHPALTPKIAVTDVHARAKKRPKRE